MIKTLIYSVRSNQLIKQIGTVFSGSAIGQVVAILTAPIITRIFSPDDFGVFALFLSVASMVGNNSQLAYYQALVIPRRNEDAQDLFILCMISTMIVSFGACIFSWGANLYGFQLEWMRKLGVWMYWLPIGILLIGTNLTISSYVIRSQQYLSVATSNVVVNLVAPFIRIGFGLQYGSSVSLLVISQFIAFFSQICVLTKSVLHEIRLAFVRYKKFQWFKAFKAFSDFPIYSLPSNILASIGMQLPVVILAATTSSAFVGYYAIANRLILRPLLPIQDAVRQVYQRNVAEKLNNCEDIRKEFFSLTIMLIMIGAIPFGILYFFGVEILVLVLGEKWSETGKIAIVLLPWLYSSFILPPANAIVLIGRFNKFRLYYQLIATILRIGILFISLITVDNPLVGLLNFSLTSAMVNVLLIAISYFATKKMMASD